MSARQSLTLRSRYRGPAFRAIETVLREYPPLADAVKTWSTREGQPGEMAPYAPGMGTTIHLTPLPFPSETLSVDATKINFAVAVELFVPGTCVDDILALWEAVEDAIVESRAFRDTTVANWLSCVVMPAPAGVIRLRPTAPAFSEVSRIKATDSDRQLIYQTGVGSLVCFLRRPA